MARTFRELENTLRRIDGRGYKAYTDLNGSWVHPDFLLVFDHVQGDPFAAPSALSAEIPLADTGLPEWATADQDSQVATRDYLTRLFSTLSRRIAKGRRGSGKGGRIEIDTPGQEILERSAVTIDDEVIRVRFFAGLPAFGRRIAGRDAAAMLLDEIPEIVGETLRYDSRLHDSLQTHVETYRDAEELRKQLLDRGWVAFVADGSVLPRASGIDPRPMKSEAALPFHSPESLRRTVRLPNRGEVSGMAIPPGVTVICGGGYHGKSTLLDALSTGIYNHIPGDGRELVVTSRRAVKIRAEDGRRIEKVCISPFINNLPREQDTDSFSSEDASGSTSQAANIIEALEAEADLLLIDEDTSATNFMIRDHRMQELIAKSDEPITPFIDKVRQLRDELGVSTILVIGGSGDYFDVADRVLAMREYEPFDETRRAMEIAERYRAERNTETGESFGILTPRAPLPGCIDPRKGKRPVKTRSRGLKTIDFGTEQIDLTAIEQLVDRSQLNSIAEILVTIGREADGKTTIGTIMRDRFGTDDPLILPHTHTGRLAAVRRHEVLAALNRLRTVRVNQVD